MLTTKPSLTAQEDKRLQELAKDIVSMLLAQPGLTLDEAAYLLVDTGAYLCAMAEKHPKPQRLGLTLAQGLSLYQP